MPELLASVRAWFKAPPRAWKPWEFQEQTWAAYARGESGLVQVPTGAGKTYAAYMGPLAELAADHAAASSPRLTILYISPLRAVSRDIELALRAPALDLAPWALVESRTGDTRASLRVKQKARLPHVLVTTPESLCLLLTRADAPELLSGVRCAIIDEWHELLSSKRGTQVELALARLRRFSPRMRTWALSATLANLTEAAAVACGGGTPTVIRSSLSRQITVDSVIPRDLKRLPLAGHLGLNMLPDVVEALDPTVPTLVFTNTRSQAERWYNAILFSKPQWAPIMALHHGSIERDDREAVESGLKSGSLRIVVATSSLDLGVDFAPVERVLQIGSPKGIGRIVQRAGRASHRPGAPCRVTCVPTHGLELFEIDAARRAIESGQVESRHPANKPLDVLSQHMVTCGLGGGFTPDSLFDEVRTAWSYRDLSREEFDWALSLVERGGDTLAAYPAYHRIKPVDGVHRVVDAKIAQMHRLNIGTIVSEATIDIRYMSGRNLGRIEENFVGHLHSGQRFVFAGKTVEFVMMRDMAAYVKPVKSKTTQTPIWAGAKLPISESLGHAVRESLEHCANGTAHSSPEIAAASGIVATQLRLSRIPASSELLIELSQSSEGFHAFIYPFEGRLVHGGLAALIAMRLTRLESATFSISVNDYGLELLSPREFDFERHIADAIFSRDRLMEDAAASLNMSELGRLQFREVARVAGLILQTYPGARKSANQAQAGAGLLYDVLTEFDPGNMLLAQAAREVLERQFEQGRLARCLERLSGSKRIIARTERFTPLSMPLVIERQAALCSSQTILERVQAVRDEWGI